MAKPLAYLGQAVVYGLIALTLGYFSMRPAFRHFADDQAQLLVSFAHKGEHKVPCRKLTREEIAELAANMRRTELCSRERLPIYVELTLSGEPIYSASLPPTGLSSDGASQAYQNFTVAPGRYQLVARLRDSARESGFDYEATADVDLEPGENYVIDFRSEMGGFLFGPNRETGSAGARGS